MGATDKKPKRVAEPWNVTVRLEGCLLDVLDVAAGVKSRSEVIVRVHLDNSRHRFCQPTVGAISTTQLSSRLNYVEMKMH